MRTDLVLDSEFSPFIGETCCAAESENVLVKLAKTRQVCGRIDDERECDDSELLRSVSGVSARPSIKREILLDNVLKVQQKGRSR
jgi:hypothetical protein